MANAKRRITITDQELRDLVAENTKNIANLAKTTDQFIQEMRKDRKAMLSDMRPIINLVSQHNTRIEALDPDRPTQKSGRTNSPTVPQAAKSR